MNDAQCEVVRQTLQFDCDRTSVVVLVWVQVPVYAYQFIPGRY